jgi:uncharacterized DUF497 family protein
MVSDIILIVIHTYRGDDRGEVIRLISAQKATPRERQAYAESQKESPPG